VKTTLKATTIAVGLLLSPTLSAIATADEWWLLVKNNDFSSSYDPSAFTKCTKDLSPPADMYEAFRSLGLFPKITDLGNVVTVTANKIGHPDEVNSLHYYRTKEACEQEAAARQAHKTDLNKYR
jgi:hypothetical protein